jgi:DNA-directed RNA polymerase specialized sigma24 family protein
MRLVSMQNKDPIGSFDLLLEWLDSDRERAAEKYVAIRQSLIQIFAWKGCSDAEFLADETLDRVILRVPEIRGTYEGNPSAYIHAVAKNVLAEHTRARSVQRETLIPENPITTEIKNEKMYGCLERCLPNLSPSSRELILDYYSVENPEEPSSRKDFAEQWGIALDQLRVRVYRIRKMLEACIQACMEHEGSA